MTLTMKVIQRKLLLRTDLWWSWHSVGSSGSLVVLHRVTDPRDYLRAVWSNQLWWCSSDNDLFSLKTHILVYCSLHKRVKHFCIKLAEIMLNAQMCLRLISSPCWSEHDDHLSCTNAAGRLELPCSALLFQACWSSPPNCSSVCQGVAEQPPWLLISRTNREFRSEFFIPPALSSNKWPESRSSTRPAPDFILCWQHRVYLYCSFVKKKTAYCDASSEHKGPSGELMTCIIYGFILL